MQVTPSEDERIARAADRVAEADQEGVPELIVAAATTSENLRIARVATVIDDELTLALADTRTCLATALKHHISMAPDPLIVAGPFSSGKRLLLQRMLTLYPDGFCLPPIYTTHPGLQGSTYQQVDDSFISELRRKGHLVHDEIVMGHSCALSYVDIRRSVFHSALPNLWKY